MKKIELSPVGLLHLMDKNATTINLKYAQEKEQYKSNI